MNVPMKVCPALVAAALPLFVTSAREEPVWDAGGGSDESLSLAENWSDDVAPTFAEAAARPFFASAGSRALVDAECFFYGLGFGGASTAFRLDGKNTVSVGAGGIDVADAHVTVIAAPLGVNSDQTWSVGADATLFVSNSFSESGTAARISKTGAGTLVLTGTNAISGGFHIRAGTVEVYSKKSPFGTTQTESARVIVDEYSGKAGLHLHDTSFDCWLYVKGGNTKDLFRFYGATNVINGKTVARNEVWRPVIYDGGTVVFNGDVDASNYIVPTCSPANTPTKCVFNGKLLMTQRYHVSAYHTLVLAAPDCEIGWVELAGVSPAVVFAADYVSRGGKVNINAYQNSNFSARIYLNGHDQEFGNLALHKAAISQWQCEINSSSPADISFCQTKDTECTDYKFTGQINLKKTGANLFAVGREMSATGSLEVAEGEFAVRAAGSWPNAVTVTASGTGIFAVENADAFSKNVEVRVAESGKLRIADGKTVRCRRFLIDGAAQESGTYGGLDSAAEHKLECFAEGSTGILDVRGGMTIMIR